MIYSQHAFMQKKGDYSDHFSSSSLEQVIGNIFHTCRGYQTFWTPCSPLKIKQGFPLPASVSIFWSGPWKQHLVYVREYHVFHSGPIPQVTDNSCTLTYVQKVYFHTCWCFIINILKENFLKLFPIVGFKAWSKKQHKFSHIYSSIVFMSSALLLYVVLRKL